MRTVPERSRSVSHVSQVPQWWEHGSESGRDVVALGAAATLSVAVLQHLTIGRIGLFFDLCFVTICLVLAVIVRRESLVTVSLLPPMLMLGVFWLVATASPGTLARPGDPVVQAVVSGMALHANALLGGYGAALVVLSQRRREFLADLCADEPGVQSWNRDGSPEPTRVTSG